MARFEKVGRGVHNAIDSSSVLSSNDQAFIHRPFAASDRAPPIYYILRAINAVLCDIF